MNIVFFPFCKYDLCRNSQLHLQKMQKSKLEAFYEYEIWISCPPIPPRAPLPGPSAQRTELLLIMALINARLSTASIQPQRLFLNLNQT